MIHGSPRRFLMIGLLQGAFSHGFVSHFANEEDRRYYLEEDPAHKAFMKTLDGIIQNIRIVDYESGVF
jgi:Stress responsive A/B Barrel Domain